MPGLVRDVYAPLPSPVQPMGIIPNNTWGVGSVEQAAKAVAGNELVRPQALDMSEAAEKGFTSFSIIVGWPPWVIIASAMRIIG